MRTHTDAVAMGYDGGLGGKEAEEFNNNKQKYFTIIKYLFIVH